MTYPHHLLRQTRARDLGRTTRRLLPIAALLGLGALASCGDSPMENVVNICSFPEDEPNLSVTPPPNFPVPLVTPGDPVTGFFRVNDATRQVRVDLTDAFDGGAPAATFETTVSGSGEVRVDFEDTADLNDRFYFKITLCADNCVAQSVVYEINVDPNATRLPENYDRVLIERGEEITRDDSCVELETVVVQ